MTTLLSARGLSKSFDGVDAVVDVDLEVTIDEIVGLIGPNGSGKSTLFGLITGFIRLSGGTVSWLKEDVTRLPAHQRARRGLVRTFQERMVFDHTTVRENLQFAAIRADLDPADDDRLAGALDVVGLPVGVMRQRAMDLSWGQTRLLGIAMALLLGPKLLLLDEPFAGLNRVAASSVTAALIRLRNEGISLVVVEHEMSLLLPLCDRVVVLAEGAKIAEAAPDVILTLPDVRAAYFGELSDAAEGSP
jgi:branched-chain amino acid transport system ATP-binding protein